MRGARGTGSVFAALEPLAPSPLAPASAFRQLHPSFAPHLRAAPATNSRDLAGLLVDLVLENARASHLEALFDYPSERSVEAGIAGGEVAAESDGCTTGGRILR